MTDELSHIDLTPICIQVWLQKTDPDYGTIEMAPGVTLQDQIDQTKAALADYADRSRARGISQRKIEKAVRTAVNIAVRGYCDLHLKLAGIHGERKNHVPPDEEVNIYRRIGLDEDEVKIDPDRGVMVSLPGMRKLRRLWGPVLPNPDRTDTHLAAMSDVYAQAKDRKLSEQTISQQLEDAWAVVGRRFSN